MVHRLAYLALAVAVAALAAAIASCGSNGSCSGCLDGGAPDANGNACNAAGTAVCTRAATCTDGGVVGLLWGDAASYDNEFFPGVSGTQSCEGFYLQGCSLFPDSGTFDASACIAIAPSLACGDGGLVLSDECHQPQH